MNCTKEPYQCPGHDCCNYNPSYETRIIYESDNESMVSHRLIIEGQTDLPGDPVYTKGFEDTISSEYVSISCCHNQEAFFWESGIVTRNSQEYFELMFQCNESGVGCGDAMIIMHPTNG